MNARHANAAKVTAELWARVGGAGAALANLELTGHEPALPSSFAVGSLAQASIAASALSAVEIHRNRTGKSQTVTVDMRDAAIEFRSERYLRRAEPLPDEPAPSIWDKIAGLYRTRDRRWVRIHTNFAHHRDGFLALLGCANEREAVQAALLQWDGPAFEDAAAKANLVCTMMRSPEEWSAHPQGKAVAALPLIEITQIGDAKPEPLPPAARPLSGVRVLDLTRIIAGPVAGRTLAAHGADVLNVTCARLPTLPMLNMDTGRGKRATSIDLDTETGRATMQSLVGDADIFMQGYRPGGLASRGFSADALAAQRPGIIAVTLSAYSHSGPWAGRRGFDSLTQNANGINWDEAQAAAPDNPVDRPKELPAQALDHAAGYLLALGAMTALQRRAEKGGSWHVRTSLAQVGEWLKSLPRVSGGLQTAEPSRDEVESRLERSPSAFGDMLSVRHAAQLSLTPAHWALPAAEPGTHKAEWLPR